MTKKEKFPSALSKEIVSFLKRKYGMTLPAISQLAKVSENSLLKIEKGESGFTVKQMTRIGIKYPNVRDIIRSFYGGKMAAWRSMRGIGLNFA